MKRGLSDREREEDEARGASSSSDRRDSNSRGSDGDDDDDLEAEVREMAERILHYRRTVPEELKATLGSFLVSYCSDPSRLGIGCSNSALGRAQSTEPENSGNEALLLRDDRETSEKLILLKTRISENVSSIPVLLGRMKECIKRIDKLGQCKIDTHIAFNRRRKTDQDV